MIALSDFIFSHPRATLALPACDRLKQPFFCCNVHVLEAAQNNTDLANFAGVHGLFVFRVDINIHRVRQAGAEGWSWSSVREKHYYLAGGWRLELE